MGFRGKLMDYPGMGIYMFFKSISVPQYQNYISFEYFCLTGGFLECSNEVLRGSGGFNGDNDGFT